jgi:hypothetical protein
MIVTYSKSQHFVKKCIESVTRLVASCQLETTITGRGNREVNIRSRSKEICEKYF